MTVTSPPVVQRFIGDDWSFAFTSFEADGVTPINLTGYTPGAELFVPYSAIPIDLTTENEGAALVSGPNGQFSLAVAAATTQTIPAVAAGACLEECPCRLQVFLLDPAGKRKTVAIVGIAALSPRSQQATLTEPETITITVQPSATFALVAAAAS